MIQFPRSASLRSIGTRLQLATALAVLTVAALLAGMYGYESSRIGQARVQVLRSVVQSAAGIAGEFEGAERAGRMTRAEAQAAAAAAIGAMRYQGDEYVFVTDLQHIIMHPIKPGLIGKSLTEIKDPTGKALFAVMAEVAQRDGSGVVDYLWPRPGSDQPVPKRSYAQRFEPWNWVLGTGVYVDDLAAARQALALALTGIGLAVAILMGSVIFLLGRSVTNPLRSLTHATGSLAAGDLTVDIVGMDRRDELGALARAMTVLRANSQERVRLEQTAAADQAAKDRRQAAMDLYIKEFGETVSGILTRLVEAAQTMRDTAEEMAQTTERTRASVMQTSDASAESSRDLATVASATVELSASVDEIARQVAHSTEATQVAVGRAEQTNATSETMSVMAGRIQDVGRVIAGIAAQTNLLALNATIEAARAGEAGKGFAVVANEVKTLAAQTAQATAEIGEKVDAIRAATDHTATAIREVGAAIERVDMVSAAIASAVEQQGATTREISSRVQAVAAAGEQTASSMAEVASISDRSGTMSRTVLLASTDIGDVAETLRIEVGHFLRVMTQDESERRRYERVPMPSVAASLRTGAGQVLPVRITDISGGGATLLTGWTAKPGEQVEFMLPGTDQSISARVVRSGNERLGIAFAQDQSTQTQVEQAIERLTRQFATSGQGAGVRHQAPLLAEAA